LLYEEYISYEGDDPQSASISFVDKNIKDTDPIELFEVPPSQSGLPVDIDEIGFEQIAMYEFFKGLEKYLPHNMSASCGYVALSGILSYYDSFYNDNVIPEKYDRTDFDSKNRSELIKNSPGVFKSGPIEDYGYFGEREVYRNNIAIATDSNDLELLKIREYVYDKYYREDFEKYAIDYRSFRRNSSF
jgi:hypothetical protein